MEIEFFDHKGQECVRIDDGRARFEEPVQKISPSGEYKITAGYWYVNDEDSDEDGDEIDGSAEAIVFKDSGIAYRVNGIEQLDDDCTIICDDGTLYILEDDAISIWSVAGKPTKKKLSCSCDDYGVSDEHIWVSGLGEDGCLRLSVFIVETGKIWTKKLSDDILCIKTVFVVRNTTDFSQIYIVAVAETYEKEMVFLKYGTDGKKQELTKCDLYEIKTLITGEIPSEDPPEPETQPIAEEVHVDTPKKKTSIWPIILIIALVIIKQIFKNA